jgi:hypothetical protein
MIGTLFHTVIKKISSSKMRLLMHVTARSYKRNEYKLLVGKTGGN